MANKLLGVENINPEDLMEIKKLSQINPSISTTCIIFEWLLIAALFFISTHYFSWYIYPLYVFLIGSRQHALGVLMHEATHYRLYKLKWLNNFVGEALLAWPLLFSLNLYRKNHLQHHKYLNTIKDPDWVRKTHASGKSKLEWNFPMSKAKLSWVMLKPLFFLDTLYLMGLLVKFSSSSKNKALNNPTTEKTKRYRLIFYFLIAVVFTITHFWTSFLLFWLIPLLSSFAFINKLRGIAEHFGIESTNKYNMSRNLKPSFIAKTLLTPYNVSYHLDHHLYPSIPFFNLKKLHKLLLKNSEYANHAHISVTHKSLFSECSHPPYS
ncbi:fatty acid desaturase family protein [Francisellaceae bacterium]|nr:fatty acid desaturase family protein [Francisellaceae bacterium]